MSDISPSDIASSPFIDSLNLVALDSLYLVSVYLIFLVLSLILPSKLLTSTSKICFLSASSASGSINNESWLNSSSRLFYILGNLSLASITSSRLSFISISNCCIFYYLILSISISSSLIIDWVLSSISVIGA